MPDLRIAVVGAGLMGADHIIRISSRIVGAVVSAVVEPDENRAKAALANLPSAKWFSNIEEALQASAMDAVLIATPGQFHESVLIPALAANLPILCEKPLTPDSSSALRVVAAEMATGRNLVQVGFMRRFDSGYMQLRELIVSKNQGELLGLHCAHRNPTVPESYHNDMLIFDSVVHEIDVVRFLTDSPIASVEVRHFKRNSKSPVHLNEPILVMLETESGVLAVVEMNVSAQFGYQVRTEAIFEEGLAEIGRTSGMLTNFSAKISMDENMSFKPRFAAAYDSQIQRWVNAAKAGKIDGPSAWDGYLAAAAVEAGLEALRSGKKVPAAYQPMPAFYQVS
ncbi:Gfo/Idh/MocA family oxidoreductase [Aquiluna borgnonia]|uniref:Inositol 2-dehydrogenase n=1 Tax=Aquiluna borgnonia TaxID=2499157 RepID=A0A7D4UB71_9MICO|nr:Gfo/Idh/MocA family oxidoreductase [Aquiluna borgnonia]QKJ25677.1 Gfo/Idh/MocA family oxidoreductase [Aquiluna borgnonia]